MTVDMTSFNLTGQVIEVNNASTFAPAKCIINYGNNQNTAEVDCWNGWTTAADLGSVQTINTISFTNSPAFGQIKIDSKALIDTSVPGGSGATDITKTVSSQASLTFTDDTELANMVGPLSQVDENGVVKTPVTSEITSVVEPTTLNAKEGNAALSYDELTPIVVYGAGTRSQTANNILWLKISDLTAAFTVTKISGNNFYIQGGNSSSSIGNMALIYDGNSPFIIDSNFGYTYCRIYAGGSGSIEYSYTYADGNPATGTTLTFATPNPDLEYFQPGDDVGTQSGFTPVLYTGNGGTQSVTGLGFSPSLIWVKNRDEDKSHRLNDVIRGAGKDLLSNAADAEWDNSTGCQSIDPDGFTVGSDGGWNGSGQGMVAWCWDAGDTTVTNNEGSTQSEVRSNGNFSVIKYTGNNTTGATVGHGLSGAPQWIIVKRIDAVENWCVYSYDNGNGGALFLNNASPEDVGPSYWNNTYADSSVFTLGSSGNVNHPGDDYIAYAWAETPGVSSFGRYSGSSSAVTLDFGFEPAFLMIKLIDGLGDDWAMFDNQRPNGLLNADLSGVENTNASGSNRAVTFTSTGAIVIGPNGQINNSGQDYIYAAFAGSTPIEVVDVDVANNTMTVDGGQWSDGQVTGFAPFAYTGSGDVQSITGVGFSPDLVWIKSRTEPEKHALFDTVRGASKLLSSNNTAAEVDDGTTLVSFDPAGFTVDGGYEVGKSGQDYIAWCWDASDTTVTNNEGTLLSEVRSNGNFSVFRWTHPNVGDASANTAGHGLNNPPSFVITKNIDAANEWSVFHSSLTLNGDGAFMNLQVQLAAVVSDTYVHDSTIFGMRSGRLVAGPMISYAWAETPGVSSFGSYAGVGGSKSIETGFEPAYVMIKNVGETTDWVVFDNLRGTQGLYPNDTGVDDWSTYAPSFTPTGFSFLVSHPALNAPGSNYIYAAFAVSSTGETQVTGPPLVATADDVEYLDGNTLGVSGVSGSWRAGLNAQGAEITATAPSPESIQYTSANGDPLTTPFTGTDATLTTRTWTWQVSNAVTGPWSDFATRIDVPGQDGAVPLADRPTLEENKFYQVKVRYDSNNAEFVESTFNTFKTGVN